MAAIFRRDSLAESEVHHLLSNSRRREILTVLWQRPGQLTVRELSERIAASESGCSPAPRPLRESVYNALHQTHLPTLAGVGLVEYDPDRKLVRPCPGSRHLSRYMDTVTPLGIAWSEYYQWLGIAGLFAVVASLAGVPIIQAIDPLVFASGSLAVFALSTCYQLVSGPRSRLARLRSRRR